MMEKSDSHDSSISAELEGTRSGETLNEKTACLAAEDTITNFRERAIDRLHSATNKHLDSLLEIGPQTDYLFDMMTAVTPAEALQVLKAALEYHEDDYNFPSEMREKMKQLVMGKECYGEGGDAYVIDLILEATLIKFHSPYPEVRAICDPMDDPSLPVETIRAYFLGICWVAIGAFVNELFSFRQPTLKLKSTALQILLYTSGKFLEKVLPDKGFTVFGSRHSLNPGPWNMKEQMLATLMVNVGSGASNFMSYALTMQLERFFNQKWVSFGFIFLLNFSTQFFGFGLAGLLRRWVVYPSKAVWPSLLPTLMLNRTLLLPETERCINGWKISKYKFFLVCLCGMMCYFWLPGYAFTALSTFNWMTWINPYSKTLAIVTGSSLGLGFNPFSTLDWAVVNYSNPLAVPFFSTANRYAGMFVCGLLMIVLYWKNFRWSSYIPINSNTAWNNKGTPYNVSEVINDDLTLNLERYKTYSPVLLSLGYVIFYFFEFALFTFSFVYIILDEWPQIKEMSRDLWNSIRHRGQSNYQRFNDPISRQMAEYPEVPDLWFAGILLISLIFAVVACEAWPTNTPSWSVLLIIVVCILLLVPSAIIMSVTGYQLGFNDIAIILAGYTVPEHAIANMICRVFGFNVDEQAESFIGDQKLGHYSKIPPRAVFRCQLLATFVQVLATVGALNVLVASIPDLCSTTQTDKFVCAFPHALFTATMVWGVVGPARTFNSLYPMLKWAFLVGALAAAPTYYGRRYLHKYLHNFNPILFLSGFTRFEASYNLSFYTPGLQASFVFMYWIRRRYPSWWTKYNYVLTSALATGVAFSGVIIFASLQATNTSFKWWGNTVAGAGLDGNRTATLLTVRDGEYFGPRTWQ